MMWWQNYVMRTEKVGDVEDWDGTWDYRGFTLLSTCEVDIIV